MKQPVRGMLVAVLSVAALGLCAQPAWAARTRVHELAESPVYKQKLGGMLGRGLLNAVTCFVDVIVNTVNDTRTGPPLIGTLTGVAKGTGCGVLRLGSGAVDVVTFWVPGFNGIPVSDSYANCLDLAPSTAASTSEYTETPVAIEPSDASTYDSSATTDATAAQTQPAERKWSK